MTGEEFKEICKSSKVATSDEAIEMSLTFNGGAVDATYTQSEAGISPVQIDDETSRQSIDKDAPIFAVTADMNHKDIAEPAGAAEIPTPVTGISTVDESVTGKSYSLIDSNTGRLNLVDDGTDDSGMATASEETSTAVSPERSNAFLSTAMLTTSGATRNDSDSNVETSLSGLDSFQWDLELSINMDFEAPALRRLSSFGLRAEPQDYWSDYDQYASDEEEVDNQEAQIIENQEQSATGSLDVPAQEQNYVNEAQCGETQEQPSHLCATKEENSDENHQNIDARKQSADGKPGEEAQDMSTQEQSMNSKWGKKFRDAGAQEQSSDDVSVGEDSSDKDNQDVDTQKQLTDDELGEEAQDAIAREQPKDRKSSEEVREDGREQFSDIDAIKEKDSDESDQDVGAREPFSDIDAIKEKDSDESDQDVGAREPFSDIDAIKEKDSNKNDQDVGAREQFSDGDSGQIESTKVDDQDVGTRKQSTVIESGGEKSFNKKHQNDQAHDEFSVRQSREEKSSDEESQVDEGQSTTEGNDDSSFYEKQNDVVIYRAAVDKEDDDDSSSQSTPHAAGRSQDTSDSDSPSCNSQLSMSVHSNQPRLPRSSAFVSRGFTYDDSLDRRQSFSSEYYGASESSAPRQHKSFKEDYYESSPPSPLLSSRYDSYSSKGEPVINSNVTVRKKRTSFTLREKDEDDVVPCRVRVSTMLRSSGDQERQPLNQFNEAPTGRDTTPRGSEDNTSFSGSDNLPSGYKSDEKEMTPHELPSIVRKDSRRLIEQAGKDDHTKPPDLSVTPTPSIWIQKKDSSIISTGRKHKIGTFSRGSSNPEPLFINKGSVNATKQPSHQEATKHRSLETAMSSIKPKDLIAAYQQQLLEDAYPDDYTENARFVKLPFRASLRVPFDKSLIEKPLPAAPKGISPVSQASEEIERTRPFLHRGKENFKFLAQSREGRMPESSEADLRREQLERDMKRMVRNSVHSSPQLEGDFQALINDLPQGELQGAQRDIDIARQGGNADTKGFWTKLFSKLKRRIHKKSGNLAIDHVQDGAPLEPCMNAAGTPGNSNYSAGSRVATALNNNVDPSAVIPDFHQPSYEAGLRNGISQAASLVNINSDRAVISTLSSQGAPSGSATEEFLSPVRLATAPSFFLTRPHPNNGSTVITDAPRRQQEMLNHLSQVREHTEGFLAVPSIGQLSSSNDNSLALQIHPLRAKIYQDHKVDPEEIQFLAHDEVESYEQYDYHDDDAYPFIPQLPYPPRASSKNSPEGGVPTSLLHFRFRRRSL